MDSSTSSQGSQRSQSLRNRDMQRVVRYSELATTNEKRTIVRYAVIGVVIILLIVAIIFGFAASPYGARFKVACSEFFKSNKTQPQQQPYLQQPTGLAYPPGYYPNMPVMPPSGMPPSTMPGMPGMAPGMMPGMPGMPGVPGGDRRMSEQEILAMIASGAGPSGPPGQPRPPYMPGMPPSAMPPHMAYMPSHMVPGGGHPGHTGPPGPPPPPPPPSMGGDGFLARAGDTSSGPSPPGGMFGNTPPNGMLGSGNPTAFGPAWTAERDPNYIDPSRPLSPPVSAA